MLITLDGYNRVLFFWFFLGGGVGSCCCHSVNLKTAAPHGHVCLYQCQIGAGWFHYNVTAGKEGRSWHCPEKERVRETERKGGEVQKHRNRGEGLLAWLSGLCDVEGGRGSVLYRCCCFCTGQIRLESKQNKSIYLHNSI